MDTPRIRDFQGKHVHMIGIGGSSMSGLAEMLVAEGYRVSGSDRTEGYALEKLRRTGIALPGTPLRAALQKQVEWLLSLAR